MTEKKNGNPYILILILAVLMALQFCVSCALADDAELEGMIPGEWNCPYNTEAEGAEPGEENLAVVTFREDGTVTLRCNCKNEAEAYTCEGTWSFELVTGGMDRIIIVFTKTDNPLHAGSEYRRECLYNVYAESWEEDNTLQTALLLEETEAGNGATPFTEIYEYDGAALYRQQGPNMRVVRCSNYVSLREQRSKTSARLAKVPLGALVLAFPEEGEENGFVLCLYGNEYGYILKEYLEPAE